MGRARERLARPQRCRSDARVRDHRRSRQSGNRIEGDRSKSLTTIGANSHHSIPMSSFHLRETCAKRIAGGCDGCGSSTLTSIRAFKRRLASILKSAPLKLRFLMQPRIPATSSADTCTGMSIRIRSPQRCSILLRGSVMVEVSFFKSRRTGSIVGDGCFKSPKGCQSLLRFLQEE